MSDNVTYIPNRLKNAAKGGYVTGAVDIIDDSKGKNQQVINQERAQDVQALDGKINAETERATGVEQAHATAIANRYTKEEVNNIVSRTPETDVIVIDIPVEYQSDIATWLDENTPSSGRANKLYRVPGPDNTTFSEWAWNGTAYIMLANKDYGIDETPTPESDNVIKSGGVFDFVKTNRITDTNAFELISGYIASATHFQQIPEGTIVYDNSETYLFTNLIELKPNKYRITTGCSTNAIAISKWDKDGNFIQSLFDGSGNVESDYNLSISSTTYIRICKHKDIEIAINKLSEQIFIQEDGNSLRFGYVSSDSNDEHSEGEIVGFDIEDLYVFSNPILLTRGLYQIESKCSSLANVLSACDSKGVFIETLLKGDGRDDSYFFNCVQNCYAILCGRKEKKMSIRPITNDIEQIPDGLVMRYGFIKTDGEIDSVTLPNQSDNFYYLYSDLIVLEQGEIIKIRAKGSGSISILSKWTFDNHFVQNLIGGTGDECEYIYQATERMCVKLCSRTDVRIRLEKIEETALTENIGILPLAWNWGFINGDGNIVASSFPDAYRYSQIVTLKAGVKYRIQLKCSESAIAVSKWVNGAFDSALYQGSYNLRNDDKYLFEIVPDADMDVRFCGREITDENAVLWYQSTYSDRLAGKAINFLGDSYVANHELNFADSWQYKMCKEHHMYPRNYGINGNGIVAGDNPMMTRYTSMDNDADYVIVVGGKNDYNQQISISDFKAGLTTLITGLISKYIARGTKIAFFTPWRVYLTNASDPQPIKLQQYVDAIVEICNQYSIPIFDSSRKSAVFMYDATFRSNYCQNSSDISHLNAAGHDYFLNKATTFIQSL